MPSANRAAGGRTATAEGTIAAVTPRKKKEKAETRKAQTTLARFFAAPEASATAVHGDTLPSPVPGSKRRLANSCRDDAGGGGDGAAKGNTAAGASSWIEIDAEEGPDKKVPKSNSEEAPPENVSEVAPGNCRGFEGARQAGTGKSADKKSSGEQPPVTSSGETATDTAPSSQGHVRGLKRPRDENGVKGPSAPEAPGCSGSNVDDDVVVLGERPHAAAAAAAASQPNDGVTSGQNLDKGLCARRRAKDFRRRSIANSGGEAVSAHADAAPADGGDGARPGKEVGMDGSGVEGQRKRNGLLPSASTPDTSVSGRVMGDDTNGSVATKAGAAGFGVAGEGVRAGHSDSRGACKKVANGGSEVREIGKSASEGASLADLGPEEGPRRSATVDVTGEAETNGSSGADGATCAAANVADAAAAATTGREGQPPGVVEDVRSSVEVTPAPVPSSSTASVAAAAEAAAAAAEAVGEAKTTAKNHKKGNDSASHSLPAHLPPHPSLPKYLAKLDAVVAGAEASGRDEDRSDRRMGLEEARDCAAAAAEAAKVGDGKVSVAPDAFPEFLAPLLARVVQGSPLPLSELSREALGVMKELASEQAGGLTADSVAGKISLVAQRKCYGAQPKKAIIPEDTSPEAMWRWEVQLMDLLPMDKAAVVKQARSERTSEGKLVKALAKLTEVMTKHPADASKISREEEKVMAFERKEEALRQKANLKEVGLAVKERARREKEESKEREKRAKEEDRRKRQEEKEAKKAEEKKAKAAAAEEEKRKQEEAKIGKVSLLKFFKVTETPSQDSKENVAPCSADQLGVRHAGSPGLGGVPLANSSELASGGSMVGRDGSEGSGCGGGGGPGDVGGGGGGIAGGGGVEVGGMGAGGSGLRSEGGFDAKQLEVFERRLREGGALEELLARTARAGRDRGQRVLKRKGLHGRRCGENPEVQVIRPKRIKVAVSVAGSGGGFGNPTYIEKQVEVRSRMKLLQFHQDHRPPYWGTWSKMSKEVTGRRPLGRDNQGILNYEYDSEEDWEEEEAQGEDLLSDEEGDKEPEDNLDYKDGWLRQDDEFSDEEKDRFGDADGEEGDADDGQARRPSAFSAAPPGSSQSWAAFGIGAGVRLGAGAAIVGTVAKAAASSAGAGSVQRAFVSSIMFRRAPITDDEMRADSALCALSVYRAVAFDGAGEGAPGEEGTDGGGFPIAVAETLFDKLKSEAQEGDGKDGSGDTRREDKGKGRPRRHKDVPDELLPALVDRLHGKADKREDIVNAFAAEHPQCTKKAVHQKVKEIATRERALLGGWVFVVSGEVLANLGVKKEDLALAPTTPAVDGPDSDTAAGNASGRSPGTGDKVKGMTQGKLAPPPGQRSLLSFLNPVPKGGDASDPPASPHPEVILEPKPESEARTCESCTEVMAPTPTPSSDAPTLPEPQPQLEKPVDDAEGVGGGSKGAVDQDEDDPTAGRSSSVTTAHEKPDAGVGPSPEGGGKERPDEDGGWEEMKESDPPMGRPVPLCKVLTPCKKVRQVAAARPVLYLGSGPPPLPRAILPKNEEDGETESDVPSRANIARSNKTSPVGDSGPEGRRSAGDGVKAAEDAGAGRDADAVGAPPANERPSGAEEVDDGSKTRGENGVQIGIPTVQVGTEPLEVVEARTAEGVGTGR